MAVFIEANYSKKLGLPQYSSHQYSVTIRTELTDVSQLAQASADLYAKLQQAVDTQILSPGFVPGTESGKSNALIPTHSPSSGPLPAARLPASSGDGELDRWKCSDKQRDLILKIVDEHGLDKAEIEKLAQDRYGTGVKQLNKLQASGLIDELLEIHGKTDASRRGNFRQSSGYGRNRR